MKSVLLGLGMFFFIAAGLFTVTSGITTEVFLACIVGAICYGAVTIARAIEKE